MVFRLDSKGSKVGIRSGKKPGKTTQKTQRTRNYNRLQGLHNSTTREGCTLVTRHRSSDENERPQPRNGMHTRLKQGAKNAVLGQGMQDEVAHPARPIAMRARHANTSQKQAATSSKGRRRRARLAQHWIPTEGVARTGESGLPLPYQFSCSEQRKQGGG